MKLRKAVKYILYAGIAISILFACCVSLFRMDVGISEFQHRRRLIGLASFPLEVGMTAERSVMSISDVFTAQVFFGAHFTPPEYEYFKVAVHTTDFEVSMDIPEIQVIGEGGYAWEQFAIKGVTHKAEDLPFNFHLSLDPTWETGNREGAVEIECTMVRMDYRGVVTMPLTLYYCGSEENVCFSTKSPEHARWLLWWHDL